jgi:hypothetical protein
MHGEVRGEVAPDRRQRISLKRLPLRVRADRYKAIEHHDGSITLVPMKSVPFVPGGKPWGCDDASCYNDAPHPEH